MFAVCFLHLGPLYNRVLSFPTGILGLRMLLISSCCIDSSSSTWPYKIVKLIRAKGIDMHATFTWGNAGEEWIGRRGYCIADCPFLIQKMIEREREREYRRCLAYFCLDPGEDFASWPRWDWKLPPEVGHRSDRPRRWDTETFGCKISSRAWPFANHKIEMMIRWMFCSYPRYVRR